MRVLVISLLAKAKAAPVTLGTAVLELATPFGMHAYEGKRLLQKVAESGSLESDPLAGAS